jgi:hypothetical protein
LSFAIVNDSDTARTITLAVPSLRNSLTLARYDYFDGERPTDANGFPVPAAVLHRARLRGGIRLTLPGRGLMVLSSLGIDRPASLHEGVRTFTDDLNDWRKTESHTRGLRIDHGATVRFDEDRSRVTSTAKSAQEIVYRVHRITSFELKVFYRKALAIRVFRGRGRSWVPVSLASASPAPGLGGHGWYLAELFPASALYQTDRLKVEFLDKRSELSQVLIGYR